MQQTKDTNKGITPNFKYAFVIGISDYSGTRKKQETTQNDGILVNYNEGGQQLVDLNNKQPQEQSNNQMNKAASQDKQISLQLDDLCHPQKDAEKICELLHSFNYIIYTNISTKRSSWKSVGSTAHQIKAKVEKLKKIAIESKNAKVEHVHFFFYFSGHGGHPSNQDVTCGIDGNGDFIDFSVFAKKFSLCARTFSLFFLDCCREKINKELEETKQTAGEHGICILKYSCQRNGQALSFTEQGLSKVTNKFITEIAKSREDPQNRKYVQLVPILDDLDANYEFPWSMPRNKWDTWYVFGTEQSTLRPQIDEQQRKLDNEKYQKFIQDYLVNPQAFGDTQKIKYEDGSKYEGQMKDGKKHGKGIFYYSSDKQQQYSDGRYEGMFQQDNFSGIGIIYDKFGRKQKHSEFRDNLENGDGIQYYKDNLSGKKILYEGQWHNGEYDGKGTLYNEDGSVLYEGSFKGGYYSGRGIEKNRKENYSYSGDYKLGKFHGNGIKRDLTSGFKLYEGTYKHGIKDGKGKNYIKVKGEEFLFYDGDFVDGVIEGNGILYNRFTDDNDDKLYEGNIKDGAFHGFGSEYYPSNGLLRYSGEYWKGKFHGKGELYDEELNKLIYVGDWFMGKRQGHGKLYDIKSGNSYEGALQNNMFNGRGVYTFQNGDEINGWFKNDRAEGRAVLTTQMTHVNIPEKKCCMRRNQANTHMLGTISWEKEEVVIYNNWNIIQRDVEKSEAFVEGKQVRKCNIF